MKTVLIIGGSHRRKGHTNDIINWLEGLLVSKNFAVERLDVNQLHIEHCLDCGHCRKHFGSCVIADDMKKVYNALKTYDNIIFASPVYFNSVSSKLKVLIDRCQMIFMCDFAHQTPYRTHPGKGAIISVAGAKFYPNQFIGSELTIGLVYKNLNLTLTEHMKISNTDDVSYHMRQKEIEKELQAFVGGFDDTQA